MTPDIVVSSAGILLSLLFSYVPGFASWYQPLDNTWKRVIMLGFLLLICGGALGLVCLGWMTFGELVVCTRDGAFYMVKVFVLALIANQATYQISPKVGYNKQ